MRLTDLSIKALKARPKGATIYSDDLLTGFGVRVSEGGTKSFVLTHGVRRERETIGRVGILALAEARAEAKRRLALYTLGKTTTASPSWDDALRSYLAYLENTVKPRTREHYKRLLTTHFRFGQTKVSDLKAEDFSKRLAKLRYRPTAPATTPSYWRSTRACDVGRMPSKILCTGLSSSEAQLTLPESGSQMGPHNLGRLGMPEIGQLAWAAVAIAIVFAVIYFISVIVSNIGVLLIVAALGAGGVYAIRSYNLRKTRV